MSRPEVVGRGKNPSSPSLWRRARKKKERKKKKRLTIQNWHWACELFFTPCTAGEAASECVAVCVSVWMAWEHLHNVRWTNKQDGSDAGKGACVRKAESGLELYLHGGDVRLGHVAVDVFDLRDVLLGHLDELGAWRLVGERRRALLFGRPVLIVVFVLLWRKRKKRKP